jgi:hypothetical protein
MKTLEELYHAIPELQDIASRLEDSQKEAKQKNNERSKSRSQNNESTTEKERRALSFNAEHAKISDYYKDGRWQQTSYTCKSGKEYFESSLMRLIDTRKPDAIKVKIFPSSRELKLRYEKVIWINESERNPDVEKHEPKNEVLGAITNQMETIQKQLLEQNKNAPITDFNSQMQLMQLQNAQALKNIQHEHEVERLTNRFELEIKELKEELEDKESEIEDLESELADVEDSLNGIDEKIEAAKNPSWLDLAGKAIGKGLENVAKENSKLVSDYLGMPEDDLRKYFIEKDNHAKEIDKTNNSSATYQTATDNDPYAHLSDDKKKYAVAFIKMVESFEVIDLQKIITVLNHLATDGKNPSVDVEIYDAMLKGAIQAKESKNNH